MHFPDGQMRSRRERHSLGRYRALLCPRVLSGPCPPTVNHDRTVVVWSDGGGNGAIPTGDVGT